MIPSPSCQPYTFPTAMTHSPLFGADIRKATPRDTPSLSGLILAVAPDDTHLPWLKKVLQDPTRLDAMLVAGMKGIEQSNKRPGRTTFMAHEGDDLAGCISLQPYRRECFQPLIRNNNPTDLAMLDSFVVAKSHRGKGIGRQLVETAETEARQAGFEKLAFSCSNQNVPMYEHLGYQQAKGLERLWLKAPLLNWLTSNVLGYPHIMTKTL